MARGDAVDQAKSDDEVSIQPSAPGEEIAVEDDQPDHHEVFTLKVVLPHEPFEVQIQVSSQEQVQDVRQSIVDQAVAMQYSCFHLEVDGTRINDFIDLSEVPGLTSMSTLKLVEDPYTEKEARMHIVRVRDLIGIVGEKVDTIYGINAGMSLYDAIAAVEDASSSDTSGGQSPHKVDFEDYDFDAPGSLKSLLLPAGAPAPKTVKSLTLSTWNPPPYQQRSQGHLLYLTAITNEGEQFQITSHISGFYVSRSSHSKFDPSPKASPKSNHAHSLLTLLQEISPSFRASFRELLEFNGQREPLALFPLSNAIPASPWMVKMPIMQADHHADASRTQETYLMAGAENAETLRDWNEEFQSTRELPRDLVQDKVFRERLTMKLYADYTEAATRGAVLVARGEIPPLNPTESRDAQIFVYNNVFFSFGADGVGTFATDGSDEAARVATGKDVAGVRAVNQLDITGLFTPGTVVVDYLGKRVVGQSIVPGIFKQREPGEHQIDYGGVEGKDVVADNETFAPSFAALSKQLHVKQHAVWDKEEKRHILEASVETKGLLGTDGRKYILDLYRITPLDVTWLEQYWTDDAAERNEPGSKDYPHRMAVLRPELIELYARSKLKEYIDEQLATSAIKEKSVVATKVDDDVDNQEKPSPDEEPTHVDMSGFKFGLNPDVYSGQSPPEEDDREEYAKDEAEVRAVCIYLTDTILPRLLTDLQEGDVGFPMDGESLAATLHKRGINLRYLGTIAKATACSESQRLRALHCLVTQEMIVRGFKHVSNHFLRHLPPVFAPACVAHLLNCLLGNRLNDRPEIVLDASMKSLYSDADFDFVNVTPDRLHALIREQVRNRFRFEVEGELVPTGSEIQVLREVCLTIGLQVAARPYIFSSNNSSASSQSEDEVATPGGLRVNGHGKSKKSSKGNGRVSRSVSPAAFKNAVTFQPDDILNFVPKVKEASPKSVLAEEAYEGGRMSLAQDQKDLGQELLLESLSLYEQIYGILHPDVARIYLQLSMVYYGLDEKIAAVELARKAVIVAERTLGIDASETILSYLNLALFEHAAGNSKVALAFVLHALNLWKVVYGPHHPDSITTINNAAVMLQSMKQYHQSRIWFEACLAISERVSGKTSVNTATLLFQLSQALALDHDTHSAVNRMRESCQLFRNLLGPDDRNTKEAEQWLDQLTLSAVNQAKRAKDLQSGKLKRVHFATQLPSSPLPVRAQSSIAHGVHGQAHDQRNIDELIRYIDGTSAKKSRKDKKRGNPKGRGQMAAA